MVRDEQPRMRAALRLLVHHEDFARLAEGARRGIRRRRAADTAQKYAGRSKSGPFPVQASTTFQPIEGGTPVNQTIEAEPGGFLKLAEPLLVTMAKRQFQSNLDNLKDLMEANAL